MSEVKKAFDLNRYVSPSVAEAASRFVDDLSALGMEASTVHFPVTYWTCDSELLLKFVEDKQHPLQDVNRQIFDLMHHPDTVSSHVVIWISPGFPQSRVNLYCSGVGREYANYSISLNLTDFGCTEIYTWLSRFKVNGLHESSPHKVLRIDLPDGISAFEYLEPQLPLPEGMWDFIKSGQPELLRKQAFEVAAQIAPAIIHEINSVAGMTDSQLIRLGARAEGLLAQAGFSISGTGSGCGLTNTEIMRAAGSSIGERSSGKGMVEQQCLPISCKCGWHPDSGDLVMLSMGLLDRCPECHRLPDGTLPEAADSVFYPHPPQADGIYIHNYQDSKPAPKSHQLPWQIYYFFPWMVQDEVTVL